MRKVLVFGAALAAASLSGAAAMPSGAEAAPHGRQATPLSGAAGLPLPTGTPTLPGAPTGTPTSTPTGTPTTPTATPRSTSGTGSAESTANEAVSSASAVQDTPKAPYQKTYAYGKQARQRVDAYWRASSKRRPGVLLIHGGYWWSGDKSDWKYVARRLTTRGYAVFAPNYRLSKSYVWPAERTDVASALTYIKRNAKRWNLDPNRIVVIGSSAGGQLGTQLGAVGKGGSRVRGVVGLSPVNTPYLAYRDGTNAAASSRQAKLRTAVVKLVRCTPGGSDKACWSRLNDANSTAHVGAGDAPMLLIHSKNDFVPVTHSTGLANALHRAGIRATVRTVPGSDHGGTLLGNAGVYNQVLNFIAAAVK